MKKTILITIVLLAGLSASAQKFTVSGYVTDAASGEPLIGVAVVDSLSRTGAVTNNFGFYSLTVSSGLRHIEVSQLGYKTIRDTISLNGNVPRNFTLEEDKQLLEGAVVTARRNNNLGVSGTQMSAVEVPLTQIKSVPAIAGEVDLLKVLQLLPGVQSSTEGAAGLHVRGGGADENLLLLDGVPLYNVNHMAGFFSVFNADAIKNVTLYKGNFPARFGSHLSSVVDVRMNDGNNQKFHGTASIGAIAAKFSLEGPIVKNRTSFAVSYRRTYADLIAQPIIAYANRNEKDSKANAGYYFYDFNAKISHKTKSGDKLTLSFYSGDDDIYAKIKDSSEYEYTDSDKNHYTGSSSDQIKLAWAWGNLISALRWTKELSPTMFMNAGVSYTQYRHSLGFNEKSSSEYYRNSTLETKASMEGEVNFTSNIRDLSATLDFEYTPSERHDIKFGTAYIFHTFRPGVSSISYKETYSDTPSQPYQTQFGDKNIYPHELALYFEDNMELLPWLKANAGIRASMYNVQGKTYWSAEPRLGVRALISDKLSLKASYSRMSQYVHLLSSTSVSLPSDLWVPVTANIRPMVSNQEALGIFYELGDFDLSLEGYYKTMDNVIEYRDGASFLGSTTGWENKVAVGKGWSYGAELLVQKTVGKTTGWVGYTLSKTMRKFDREGNVLNGGLPFPAKYDRRHDFNVTVTHKFSERIDLSGTFVLSSGNCGTLSYRDFIAYTPGDVENRRYEAGYYESRNNFRMPTYHRADIGVNFHKQKKHGIRTWNISVYNFYNHQNPFIVYRTTENNAQGQSYGVVKQLSIFPIIPSVSYTYKF